MNCPHCGKPIDGVPTETAETWKQQNPEESNPKTFSEWVDALWPDDAENPHPPLATTCSEVALTSTSSGEVE